MATRTNSIIEYKLYIRTYERSRSISLARALLVCLSHQHTRTHAYTRVCTIFDHGTYTIHTHMHTPSLILTRAQTHARSLSISLAQKHTHTHSRTHAHTRTHTRTLSLFLSKLALSIAKMHPPFTSPYFPYLASFCYRFTSSTSRASLICSFSHKHTRAHPNKQTRKHSQCTSNFLL